MEMKLETILVNNKGYQKEKRKGSFGTRSNKGSGMFGFH